MRAVILAGGKGTRLAPFTSVLPKPLIPIGDRAILEIIVEQLRGYGFRDLTFCVGYLAHLIQAVFDARTNRDVSITYVREEEPLGTAAPLRRVDGLDRTFLVMNGDILTQLDYRELVQRHEQEGNVLTIAGHERRTKLDYGVLHLEESESRLRQVTAFEEKPELRLMVSMGIYVMDPRALEFIPSDRYFDFPELVRALLEAGERVGAVAYDGFWLDLGRHEDYEAAMAWEQERHALAKQGLPSEQT